MVAECGRPTAPTSGCNVGSLILWDEEIITSQLRGNIIESNLSHTFWCIKFHSLYKKLASMTWKNSYRILPLSPLPFETDHRSAAFILVMSQQPLSHPPQDEGEEDGRSVVSIRYKNQLKQLLRDLNEPPTKPHSIYLGASGIGNDSFKLKRTFTGLDWAGHYPCYIVLFHLKKHNVTAAAPL
jgi:hypothetical protein